MVKFIDTQGKVGVAIAPFKWMPFLPRIGERLTLPETPDGLTCSDFRVSDIHYVCFSEDVEIDDAQLINVRVNVERISTSSN